MLREFQEEIQRLRAQLAAQEKGVVMVDGKEVPLSMMAQAKEEVVVEKVVEKVVEREVSGIVVVIIVLVTGCPAGPVSKGWLTPKAQSPPPPFLLLLLVLLVFVP